MPKENILSIEKLKMLGFDSNAPISETELLQAQKILLEIHQKTNTAINNGYGPFYAEIYNSKYECIASTSNSVITDNCSISHAEINAIKQAHKNYQKYDLSEENLSIYINAEPCIMCIGAIMWSGIKNVFYSVPTNIVEKTTGFDEGFKPNWLEEFKQRNIKVYGNIAKEEGIKVLSKYVENGNKIYKPTH